MSLLLACQAADAREESAMIRRAIERERHANARERVALDNEHTRTESERDALARQRARLAQDRKAFEAEKRDLARLRDELVRRKALARKGRRAPSEPLPVIADHGTALRPDPSTATTPAQFTTL